MCQNKQLPDVQNARPMYPTNDNLVGNSKGLDSGYPRWIIYLVHDSRRCRYLYSLIHVFNAACVKIKEHVYVAITRPWNQRHQIQHSSDRRNMVLTNHPPKMLWIVLASLIGSYLLSVQGQVQATMTWFAMILRQKGEISLLEWRLPTEEVFPMLSFEEKRKERRKEENKTEKPVSSLGNDLSKVGKWT